MVTLYRAQEGRKKTLLQVPPFGRERTRHFVPIGNIHYWRRLSGLTLTERSRSEKRQPVDSSSTERTPSILSPRGNLASCTRERKGERGKTRFSPLATAHCKGRSSVFRGRFPHRIQKRKKRSEKETDPTTKFRSTNSRRRSLRLLYPNGQYSNAGRYLG